MANAVADKPKIKDDEFDIHGDLAVSEADDKSFVVLYDSSKEASTPEAPQGRQAAGSPSAPAPVAPTLEEMNESRVIAPDDDSHAGDAYIDEILSSDDIDNEPKIAPARAIAADTSGDTDDGPISLSSEELDGILEMGPAAEEEFHPDFPVDTEVPGQARTGMSGSMTVDTEVPGSVKGPAEDDDLPIALSDEDLDEILLEEEGTIPQGVEHHAPLPPSPAAMAPQTQEPDISPPPMDFDQAEPAPMADLGDEEPIALSDDELDHILADAEAGHHEGGGVSAPELTQHHEDEILTLDDGPEITMIDDGALTSASAADARSDAGGGFFDSDEDEPITLSDEELDGILSTAPEEDAPKQTQEVKLAELPDDGIVDVQDESPAQHADDEPIALSADELDGILMDADEPQEGLAELPPADADFRGDADVAPAPQAEDAGGKDFFESSDEDEPIALSAEELDGIAATATPEEVAHEAPTTAQNDLANLPPEGMDDRYADVDHMEDTTAASVDDEGPIALSADELDGIAADAREVTPEAPMVPLAPGDAMPGEPSLAENTEKPATVFEEDLEAATLIHEDDAASQPAAAANAPETEELKSVMGYLDNLLGELPDDVIEKFAQSEYFKLYQKIMDKLGL